MGRRDGAAVAPGDDISAAAPGGEAAVPDDETDDVAAAAAPGDDNDDDRGPGYHHGGVSTSLPSAHPGRYTAIKCLQAPFPALLALRRQTPVLPDS